MNFIFGLKAKTAMETLKTSQEEASAWRLVLVGIGRSIRRAAAAHVGDLSSVSAFDDFYDFAERHVGRPLRCYQKKDCVYLVREEEP